MQKHPVSSQQSGGLVPAELYQVLPGFREAFCLRGGMKQKVNWVICELKTKLKGFEDNNINTCSTPWQKEIKES